MIGKGRHSTRQANLHKALARICGAAPLPLGTRVKPWGKIAAVMMWEGERMYMFRGCCVTLMPCSVVESQHKENQRGK